MQRTIKMEDERVWSVKQLLFDYVRSPSLRHIRDAHSLNKLANEIVRRIDLGNSIWKKWDGQRELLLKSSIGCWVPINDLRDFLNQMPGPKLTTTDVTQRLRALEDEDFLSYPKEELQPGCLTIYEKEKNEGTELPSIIGLLREHLDHEENRLRDEQAAKYQRLREEDRAAREQRLLSGADSPWVQLQKSSNWYCRKNGRTYRLSPTKDKKWQLSRVVSVSDDEQAAVLGTYLQRGEATKVVAKMAYQPESRW
jgi:hypothetical protein